MKKYNIQKIIVKVKDLKFNFYCYTYDRRNGFTEVVECLNKEQKEHYYNRSWQRYDYENAIHNWFKNNLGIKLTPFDIIKPDFE